MAHKPEHAMDLDSGAVVAVEVHEADKGDTSTLPKTLEAARRAVYNNRARISSGAGRMSRNGICSTWPGSISAC
ncbi:hypothetical protein [Fundidesulfovibrio butyratiphilus]